MPSYVVEWSLACDVMNGAEATTAPATAAATRNGRSVTFAPSRPPGRRCGTAAGSVPSGAGDSGPASFVPRGRQASGSPAGSFSSVRAAASTEVSERIVASSRPAPRESAGARGLMLAPSGMGSAAARRTRRAAGADLPTVAVGSARVLGVLGVMTLLVAGGWEGWEGVANRVRLEGV